MSVLDHARDDGKHRKGRRASPSKWDSLTLVCVRQRVSPLTLRKAN